MDRDEQDDINFDEVVEAVKASLKDNNNVNPEVEEYINKEREMVNNAIASLKTQDLPSSHSQKSLAEVLQILNSEKKGANINTNNSNDNDDKQHNSNTFV